MVTEEIKNNRQFKIMEGNEVAGIFAIAFNDEQLWKERSAEPAVYIHRIVTPLARTNIKTASYYFQSYTKIGCGFQPLIFVMSVTKRAKKSRITTMVLRDFIV